MRIRPADAALLPKGRKRQRIPRKITASPRRIIRVSPSFIVRKPLIALPAVIPRKNRLTKPAAASAEIPLHNTR